MAPILKHQKINLNLEEFVKKLLQSCKAKNRNKIAEMLHSFYQFMRGVEGFAENWKPLLPYFKYQNEEWSINELDILSQVHITYKNKKIKIPIQWEQKVILLVKTINNSNSFFYIPSFLSPFAQATRCESTKLIADNAIRFRQYSERSEGNCLKPILYEVMP